MATDAAERPSVEERYQAAAGTSNLRLDTRDGAPIKDADVIAAAGAAQTTHDGGKPIAWSARRLGMALLRLHSEWDSAAKPRRVSGDLIEALAATIRAEDAQAMSAAERRGAVYENRGPALSRAHNRAHRWYVSELRLLAVSLKSRAAVWEQLEHWGALRGIDSGMVAEALLHWLSPKCSHCDGHGFLRLPDAPTLSTKRCPHCHGTGETPIPRGMALVLNCLDDSVDQARTSLKSRLRRS